MGKTFVEKVFEDRLKREVSIGEFIEIEPDLALANDITAPLAIKEFKEIKRPLLHPEKIVLVEDHFVPNKDVRSANQAKILKDFAKEYKIKNYFQIGTGGVEHALLPEEGLVLPGDIVIGADSHTTTYGALSCFSTGVGSTDIAYFMATGKTWFKVPESIRFIFYGRLNKWVSGKDLILYVIGKIGVDGANYCSMEFSGETIKELTMSDRLTMSNMAIEGGGKSGIFEVDEKTLDYIKDKAKREYKIYRSDQDANYRNIYEFDCIKIEPQVACPPLPSNTKPAKELSHIKIDQAFIGSCTNGRLEDLKVSASILNGNKVHPDVRLIVIPATQKIYKEAVKEGLIDVFISSGGIVSCPTCGPCLGGHMGVLADYEVCISTTNRNFTGRMGSMKSEVYLANPAVVSASAILGRIAHPDEV
ncbi:TPA: 3-isopropylmalate dehydratase large subunit [bacterium]|nr:3-isopropylmalate dehydratase large subunit [bacterium]